MTVNKVACFYISILLLRKFSRDCNFVVQWAIFKINRFNWNHLVKYCVLRNTHKSKHSVLPRVFNRDNYSDQNRKFNWSDYLLLQRFSEDEKGFQLNLVIKVADSAVSETRFKIVKHKNQECCVCFWIQSKC